MDPIDWFFTTPLPHRPLHISASCSIWWSLSVFGLALALAWFAPRGRKQAIIHGWLGLSLALWCLWSLSSPSLCWSQPSLNHLQGSMGLLTPDSTLISQCTFTGCLWGRVPLTHWVNAFINPRALPGSRVPLSCSSSYSFNWEQWQCVFRGRRDLLGFKKIGWQNPYFGI